MHPHPFSLSLSLSLSLGRGERRLRNSFTLDAAHRLLVLSSKGREENISKNTRGLFAVVKYEICCNKANKKRNRGSGANNAKGSCQDPKTSVVIHDLLFFYNAVYCLYGYLSGKFSSVKEVIGSNE